MGGRISASGVDSVGPVVLCFFQGRHSLALGYRLDPIVLSAQSASALPQAAALAGFSLLSPPAPLGGRISAYGADSFSPAGLCFLQGRHSPALGYRLDPIVLSSQSASALPQAGALAGFSLLSPQAPLGGRISAYGADSVGPVVLCFLQGFFQGRHSPALGYNG